jgi:hypothetical protein
MSSADLHIQDQYPEAKRLLEQVATYYPEQFNHYKLSQASVIGSGTDAYAFAVKGSVLKFTQSRSHAKVSLALSKSLDQKRGRNLVRTNSVFFLKHMGLWLIIEELLLSPTIKQKRYLSKYFDAAGPQPEDPNINEIIQDLHKLGIADWGLDCVTSHNILVDPKTKRYKAFDFGYTRSSLPENWPVWA